MAEHDAYWEAHKDELKGIDTTEEAHYTDYKGRPFPGTFTKRVTERSVSIFLFDSYPGALEIEEYRAFTTDDSVPGKVIKEHAIRLLHQNLWDTSSLDYTRNVISTLDDGNEDFRVDLGKEAVTRVVVIRNTPATSFLVVKDQPGNQFGIKI